MAAAPTSSFMASMQPQPPRTVHALVNEETRASPPVRLYPSQHRVSMTRYATSTDPRGYIPVFEYPLNGQYIMIDCETGMVHFTGIWKALGHTKADVVKLVESDPTIAPYLRKVRGGYLKIQGTWLPFETAQTLARRVAWQVRYDLIPLFGPEFPDTCLGPGEPGFGQLLLSAPKPRGRRGTKKTATASAVASKERTSVSSTHDTSMRPASYPGHDSVNNRPSSNSLETPGVVNGYGSSQSRYSPYARLPAHGITQLEPMPSLIQSNQNNTNQAVVSMYPNHYQQGSRASVIQPSGAAPSQFSSSMNGAHITAGSTASGLESGVMLPTMRNFQSNPVQNNFFETYRGPDSFEALSNKWLAPEATSSTSLTENGLLNGENCLPPVQYSTEVMPRKSPAAATINQYAFSNTLDAMHPGHPRGSDHTQQSHHPAGYAFDPRYETNYHQGLVRDTKGRRPSSSPDYSAGNPTTYDQTYAKDSRPVSKGKLSGGCYVPTQSSSSENPSGSPGSHCSHPPKSPTPSSASTSTHLHNSHNLHSNRSSSNTLGGMSTLGGLNRQNEDMNHFSVLTSPAHLDVGATVDTSVTTVQNSDSDWNSLGNSNDPSPPQQDS